MRILHAASTLRLPLGGAEKYALDLAIAQQAQGHEVSMITTLVDDQIRHLCASHGIDLRLVSRWRPYAADKQGTSITRKLVFHGLDLADHRHADIVVEPTDVLHVHRFQGLGPGVFRVGVRARRVVHTVHDYALVDTTATSVRAGALPSDLGLLQRRRAKLIGASLRKCDAVIFPSERTLERHQELGFRHHRSIVVPHGWPGSGARPRARALRAGDKVTFGFLGKVEPHKGSRLLAEAWGQGMPDARLIVAGAGSDAHLFRGPGIEYLGYVSGAGLGDFFDRIDILVVPSLWPENFPLVVAEGLLAGCGFLTTADASPPLVVPQVNGTLVRGTAEALREGMATIVADKELSVAAYSEASLRLSSALDMGVHLERLDSVYRTGGAPH